MRILIVDDHALVRRGITALLGDHFEGLACGECEDARRGFELATSQPWDLVIIDLSLPGRSGLDLIQDLRHAKPELPLLVVSTHPEKDFAVRALKLGAAGYVSKQSAPDILVAAVRRILAGGRYVSPALAEHLAGALAGHGSVAEEPHETLSNRELEVLRLIALGRTLKEIGADLSLSEKTIATYRARISDKMGLASNVDLTRYAMRHGLVE